jgi:DUF4097 and DUF4098 domain-containing protein YvlB
MTRNFNLSGIGLGIYLLGLGIAYILNQATAFNVINFWLHLYPILAIVLGLDYILSSMNRTAQTFTKPNDFVATIIIIITVIGLVSSLIPKFVMDDMRFHQFGVFNHNSWDRSSQFTVNEDFKLPTGVTTINITNQFGDVNIDNTTSDTISAKAQIRLPFHQYKIAALRNTFKLVGQVQGDSFLITLQQPEKLGFAARHMNSNITVDIPKGLSVTIKNSAGNVQVGNIEGNLNIEMSAGNFQVQSVGRDLKVRNKFGNINIGTVLGNLDAITKAGEIKIGTIHGNSNIESMAGNINLEECYGFVSAKLETGNLNLNLAKIKGDCDLETNMGNVDLSLPTDAKFSLDAACAIGNINSNFTVPIKKEMTSAIVNAEVNGGGPLIKIRTKAGNIDLHKL